MKQTKVKATSVILSKKVNAPFTRDNGFLKKQWYLKSFKAPQLAPGADVNVLEAWKITRGDRRIVVAIIDGSFDLNHSDLNLPGKIVFPNNYITKKQATFLENGIGINHGTMCAGIAVADGGRKGMLGVAPECSFMPVSVPPHASEDLMIKVFHQTALHADVISCSWSPPPVYAPLSEKLYHTLKEIAENGGPRKKGVVICFSASNYNAPVNDPGNYQFFWFDKYTNSIKITRGPILNGYAAHPAVITVSASTSLNTKALYSNWGKEISVCAPSNNSHPIVKKSPLKGHKRIWTTFGQSNNKGFNSMHNSYTKDFGGTSCSTALVAGVAALVLSANPELKAAEVKKILQDTADKIVDKEPDMILENQKGVYVNGHSEWFGYGKVNAGRAVKQARRMRRINY